MSDKTFIWLDHDIEDPRQIIVVACTVDEARDIARDRIVKSVREDKAERADLYPSYWEQQEHKDNPEKIAQLRSEQVLREQNGAEKHILLVISREPNQVLEYGDFFYEGYFYAGGAK